ncbi:MAG: hypothetical protein GX287_02850 [Fusobacteria bacterium]|nr:hypothetical protein [Fusobacteriota bacterium]
MSIIKFTPKKPVKPLFAIKLPPIINKICSFLDEKEMELALKVALKIDASRMIAVIPVSDIEGNDASILVLFDFKYRLKKPKYVIPETEMGFFDFRIYDIDFNKNIDLEKFIKNEKEFAKRFF